MHMADALISPSVGACFALVSGALLAYSVGQSKKNFDAEKIPLMGVMGAFVFAAQMINFAIPPTGSSGHIGGAILLSALLSPFRAFLVMACVLAIQAFLFADGGILALGCNIFNLGFWGCFIAYPLCFKPFFKDGISNQKIMAASIVACVVSLQLGAFSVVLETLASGITNLPFGIFAGFMQSIHLAIGLAEGAATGGLLIFIYAARPQVLEVSVKSDARNKWTMSYAALLAMLTLGGFALAGGLSLAASSDPDGLEWAIGKTAPNTELTGTSEVHKQSAALTEKTSLLADYTIGQKEDQWRSFLAGVIGTAVTLALICLAGFAVSKMRGARRKNVE